MSDLFNKKKLTHKIITKESNYTVNNKTTKNFPSSIREWNNSIYLYNKKGLDLIPSTTFSALKIIKGYFNLFNKTLEKKMRTKRLLLRLRRLSSNKIYISNGEFKHTNNKVLINLYLFNRQRHNFLSKIKAIYIKRFLTMSTNININNNIINKLSNVYTKGFEALKTVNGEKYLFLKSFNKDFKSLSEYTSSFYVKIFRKTLKKMQLYFYYKQLIYINKSKLSYTYLQHIKKHLEKLYGKNVEFNLINLKRFYLNSDILSEVVRLKLTRNRRKLLKTMNKVKNKIKIHKKSIFLGKIDQSKKITENVRMIESSSSLEKLIINNLKYRHTTGFRLEAKGRLTRRYTASRSLSKLRYKGNLLGIDSSHRGLSSVLLKGNLKSNLQYTKLKSKSRIGSFGIKGWISGN